MSYGIKIYGEKGNTQIDSEAEHMVFSRKQTVNLKEDMWRDQYQWKIWAAMGHLHSINFNRENEMYAMRSDQYVYMTVTKDGLLMRQTLHASKGTAEVYVFEKAKDAVVTQYGISMTNSKGVTQNLGDKGIMKALDVKIYPSNVRNISIPLPSDKKVAVMLGGSTLVSTIEKYNKDEGFFLYGMYARIVNNTLEINLQKMMWDAYYDPYEYIDWKTSEVRMPITVTLVDVTGL